MPKGLRKICKFSGLSGCNILQNPRRSEVSKGRYGGNNKEANNAKKLRHIEHEKGLDNRYCHELIISNNDVPNSIKFMIAFIGSCLNVSGH